MLANCLHDLTAIGADGLLAVAIALFLAGLAGGVTHCAGMCAPFVIAQAGAVAGRSMAGGYLSRLSGAALVPYHLGRVIGYAGLGAVSGLSAGALSQISGLRVVLAVLLAVAAGLMLAQAAHRLPPSWRIRMRTGVRFPANFPGLRWTDRITGRVGKLLAAPTGWNGIFLGLLLSGLPCGLLYAALAGAAATGSALAGAIAMAAFCLGTVPALVGVGMLGRLFLRTRGDVVRLAGALLFCLNGVILAAMAFKLVA